MYNRVWSGTVFGLGPGTYLNKKAQNPNLYSLSSIQHHLCCEWRKNGDEFGGFKSDTNSLHETTRPQIPSMDARPVSTSSHRVGSSHSWRRIPDATFMDPRSTQYLYFPLFLQSFSHYKFPIFFLFLQSVLLLSWIKIWFLGNLIMMILMLKASFWLFRLKYDHGLYLCI